MNTPNVTTLARTRLEQTVAQGVAKTGPIVQQILGSMPVDEVTPVRETGFIVGDHATPLYSTRIGASPLSSHAFGQLMSRTGVPAAYARTLLEDSAKEGGEWKARLLENTMDQFLAHSPERYLVRRVNGQVRGVLSDCYRRLDSRPLLESFIKASKDIGAVPVGGVATETRVSLRAIVPTIIEPVPGEAMVFGLNWANSDFGAGTYSISAFVLRLLCLNGMVGESQLKKVHIGARLAEDASFSEMTHKLDQATLISATGDVVRALLSPAAIQEREIAIRAAHSRELTFEAAWKSVGKQLTKSEREAVKDAYEGPDTLNMPAGQTMWRFANALSWVANSDKVSDETRIDLQSMAGKLLSV